MSGEISTSDLSLDIRLRQRAPFRLPFRQLLVNPLNDLLDSRRLPKRVHKLSVRVHEVEVYTVVHQIIVRGLSIWRRTEVHPICSAHLFGSVVVARKADHAGVEVLDVASHLLKCVAGGVDGDEDGLKDRSVLLVYIARSVTVGCAKSVRLTEYVHCLRHFVELLWTDIRTVGEAKVYQAPAPKKISVCERLALVRRHFEGSADVRASV